MKAKSQFVKTSSAFLPENFPILRKPRCGWKKRGKEFFENFEQYNIFYDVFWHANGKDILLLGPPPRNLLPLLKKATYRVDGEEKLYSPDFFITQSVMIISLKNAPRRAKILIVEFEGLEYELAIQENLSQKLANKRIMFTMSKNNELSWIGAWADYHQYFHNIDSIVFIDNGSSNISLKQIGKELETTNIENIYIISLPYIYGAIDRAVLSYHYWTHFLQIAGMNLILRRFAARAEGLLNCDIDELVVTKNHRTIFDELKQTSNGLLVMQGIWVEPYPLKPNEVAHKKFAYIHNDKKINICNAKKWLLDPKQSWVSNLSIHPYMHWIENRPANSKTLSNNSYFWHFKGINNNWKIKRNIISKESPKDIHIDENLIEQFSRWPYAKEK